MIPPRIARWEAAEKLHITLRFIGPFPHDRLPELIEYLGQHLTAEIPFNINFGKAVIRSRRMIWLVPCMGVEPLHRLHRSVESAIEPFGLKPSAGFSAHINMARLRDNAPLDQLTQAVNSQSYPQLPVLRVDRISLMNSELLPSGSRYSRLEHFMLCGNGG